MASIEKPETLGKRIRRLREKKKVRQIDLAAAAQISWRHLIRIEQDAGGVTKAATLERLAEALGVDVRELSGDEDDEEAHPVNLDDILRLRIRQIVREEASAL